MLFMNCGTIQLMNVTAGKVFKEANNICSDHFLIVKMAAQVAQELLDKNTELYIMVIGKPGIGKSTVLNGIIGKEVAEVGPLMMVLTEGVTKDIVEYKLKGEKHYIYVYDTPGLYDQSVKMDVMAEIRKKAEKVDIFLVGIDMTQTRLLQDAQEWKMMNDLKKILGNDMWKKTIILLTKGNLVINALTDQKKTKKEIKAAFDDCISRYKDIIAKQLKGIASDQLTIAVAGSSQKPYLLDGDETAWFSKLWMQVLNKLRSDEAKVTLLKANWDRLITQKVTLEQVIRNPLSRQPIDVSLLQKYLIGGILGGSTGLGGGAFAVGGAGAIAAKAAAGSTALSLTTEAGAVAGAVAALSNPVGLIVLASLGVIGAGGGIAYVYAKGSRRTE